MIKLNEKVKDFSLKDGCGKEHRLSDYLGKKVVVYIYPKNNTPGCNSQACSFRDNMDVYKEKDIIVLGISKDSVESHSNFKLEFDLNFITLSDESLEVIKYFGAYGEKKMFGKTYDGVFRMTFVIDEKGFLILKMPKVSAKNNALEVLDLIDNYEKNN